MIKYQHRQTGNTILVALGAAALACLVLAVGAPSALIGVSMALVLAICAALFSSLSVEVTDEHLRWHFGVGLIRKQVLLSEIDAAEATRTNLLSGWGIHLTLRGWLYNVSGFEAVAIRLKSGKQFLLGTDEPERLASILREERTRRLT